MAKLDCTDENQRNNRACPTQKSNVCTLAQDLSVVDATTIRPLQFKPSLPPPLQDPWARMNDHRASLRFQL